MDTEKPVRKPTRAQFEQRLTRLRKCDDASAKFRLGIAVRNGSFAIAYLGTKERKKYEKLYAAWSKAWDSFFATLQTVSPRDWKYNVPVPWIISEVSWQMATSSGAIPVPPPCINGRPNDEWAAALPEKKESK